MSLRTVLFVGLILASSVAAAAPYRLAPYKDDLFAYPKVLNTQDDGAYVVVQYLTQRDIIDRDEIPERRTHPQYVDLVPQRTETITRGAVNVKYIGVGRTSGGARAIVIYLHGQNGSRYQGADQWMFGGNFSRVMNLMVRNDGAYLSPDFSNFGTTGTGEIKALMQDQAEKSPGAPIFVACGSMGGRLCWNLAKDPEAAALLGGLLLVGSNHDDDFLKSPQIKGKAPAFPIYLGHGTRDPIFGWQGEVDFYNKVRKAAPGYPIRFVLFDDGSHGLPIRMTDWRLVLNWMLEVDGK
jgi:pimeloyl-ACP methyl ester carboxylesterase